MLSRLSIRDIVLIERLDIDYASGLAVLTGETGAGKSILLDAFALALGSRGDASLVRQGAEQGQVTAVDRATLLGYCVKYAQWQALEAEARTHPAVVKAPSGYPMPNPLLAMAKLAHPKLRPSATRSSRDRE